MTLKEPFEISIKRFRESVEAIKDEDMKFQMMLGYLLAARNCELVTKVSQGQLLQHRSRNYGVFLRANFKDFIALPNSPEGIQLGLKEPFQQKVLVFRVATAKRGKRVKEKDRDKESQIEVTSEEIEKALTKYQQSELLKKWKAGQVTVDPLLIKVLNGDLHLRYVALPTSITFEPWVLELLKYTKKKTISLENFGLNMTTRTFLRTLREALGEILPPIHAHGKDSMKNILRHIRIHHLLGYYGFSPFDVNCYTGWSLSGIFGQVGQAVSGNLELYAHLSWKFYLPKLCVPMERFTGQIQIAQAHGS